MTTVGPSDADRATVGGRETPEERQARESQQRLAVLLAKKTLTAYELGEAAALARRGGTAEQKQQVDARVQRARQAKAKADPSRPATMRDVEELVQRQATAMRQRLDDLFD